MGATCPACQDGEFDVVDSYCEGRTLVEEQVCDNCGAQVITQGEVRPAQGGGAPYA